ncbi:hypothetical protein R9C00_06990 [Flammeovirgaceae bacterium SG7u.111]|nr:hypothetical protein [Flammeovirgaceae bacterium SG7u.132]WPO37189.1 hypothetical protein R9C00_06990 [Flammeovirgaceae bacterium SG7u.111]
MPIATIYTQEPISQEKWEAVVFSWAQKIRVDVKDISIHIVSNFMTAGAKYDMKVHLFLPSLWGESPIKEIQNTFLETVQDKLGVSEKEVIIITQIIDSGHVVDRGKTEKWDS